MSRIRGKDTKPELLVRKWMWSHGYRYRLYSKNLPGKPDIILPGRKKVIFINGCFWHKHGCRFFKWPSSNQSYWKDKIEGTVRRDQQNIKCLTSSGWEVFIVWECELKDTPGSCLWERLDKFLGSSIQRSK